MLMRIALWWIGRLFNDAINLPDIDRWYKTLCKGFPDRSCISYRPTLCQMNRLVRLVYYQLGKLIHIDSVLDWKTQPELFQNFKFVIRSKWYTVLVGRPGSNVMASHGPIVVKRTLKQPEVFRMSSCGRRTRLRITRRIFRRFSQTLLITRSDSRSFRNP